MSKSVSRASSRRTRLPLKFGRVLFACVTALVLFVVIAGGLNLRSSAQSGNTQQSAREASFNRNEGADSIHARGTVPAGGSQTLDFNVNGDAYKERRDSQACL